MLGEWKSSTLRNPSGIHIGENAIISYGMEFSSTDARGCKSVISDDGTQNKKTQKSFVTVSPLLGLLERIDKSRPQPERSLLLEEGPMVVQLKNIILE